MFMRKCLNSLKFSHFSSLPTYMHFSTIHVCIVGSGPGGFYCAQHLLKVTPDINIDIYEKLPVPFGLVRFGVAPDHPEVKNVINTFTKVALDKRVRFCGNVTLGRDVSLKQLCASYHVVVLAYGTDEDVRLGIPGEKLGNVISAREFVGWYNGLPQCRDVKVDLEASDTAVIFGQGNVAIDVARILLKSPDELKDTDITEYSLDKLRTSKIRQVFMVGRRGPLQAAFTIKEFREMTKLSDVNTILHNVDVSNVDISNLPRPRKRLTELLLKVHTEMCSNNGKTFHIVFLRSPQRIIGSTNVEGAEFSVNILHGETYDKQKAQATDKTETISCGLALRSIGYRSTTADPDIILEKEGCICKSALPVNVRATGWLATGPVGVILSTMTNAFQTADSIAEDIKNGKIHLEGCKGGFSEISSILKSKNILTVDWKGWEKIDAEEIERGKRRGKPREKIVDFSKMLEIAFS